MVDVSVRTVISRPRHVVAGWAGNPENAPTWYVNIHQAEWVGAAGVRLGARIAFRARFLGRDLAYTYEIVDFAEGERLVMRTSEGPFPMETSYTWTEVAGGTEMVLRNRGTPSGFSRWLAPVMAFAMRRATTADLARLKALLERDSTPP